jgi:hypothetical protein
LAASYLVSLERSMQNAEHKFLGEVHFNALEFWDGQAVSREFLVDQADGLASSELGDLDLWVLA